QGPGRHPSRGGLLHPRWNPALRAAAAALKADFHLGDESVVGTELKHLCGRGPTAAVGASELTGCRRHFGQGSGDLCSQTENTTKLTGSAVRRTGGEFSRGRVEWPASVVLLHRSMGCSRAIRVRPTLSSTMPPPARAIASWTSDAELAVPWPIPLGGWVPPTSSRSTPLRRSSEWCAGGSPKPMFAWPGPRKCPSTRVHSP